jgi:outer membrane biosynthesis protein TonB
MWPWQQSELKKKKLSLWLKLIGLSTLLHLCMLMLLLVAYRGYYAQYALDISQRFSADTPVVFLPLQKTVMARGGKKGRGSKSKGKKQAASAATTAEPVKNDTPEAAPAPAPTAAPVVEAAPVPVVPDKAPIAIMTESAVKKQKSNSTKKESRRARAQAAAAKKSKKQRKEAAVAAPQEEKKASLQEQHVAETKKVTKEEPIAVAVTHNALMGDNLIEGPDTLYLGQVERDAFLLQQEIFNEIENHWRPPVGLGSEKLCEIKLLVDWDGSIKELKVAHTSGVVAFDVAARSAIIAMALPKAAWGKELILHFKS